MTTGRLSPDKCWPLAIASSSQAALNAYSKLASGQAGLLAETHPAEAEQIYRVATELSPGNPEAVFQQVSLLLSQNRPQDALLTVQAAVTAAPENQQFRELLTQLGKTTAK